MTSSGKTGSRAGGCSRLLTLMLIALCVWIAGMRHFEVEGVRMVIRFTARTSLLFFCLAFSAAALARLWPNAFTRWLHRDRRYLGATFLALHALHDKAIIVFASVDPAGYAAATSLASYVFGGMGYTFVVAITTTSFDATAATLSARAPGARCISSAAITSCCSSRSRSASGFRTCRSTRCS